MSASSVEVQRHRRLCRRTAASARSMPAGSARCAAARAPGARPRMRLLDDQLPDGDRIDRHRAAEPDRRRRSCCIAGARCARLLTGGDLGFAEAYVDGDWATPDLTALLELCRATKQAWWPRARLRRDPAAGSARHAPAARNTRRGSRRNISFHYDLGNDFYAAWLDPRMIYSARALSRRGETLEAGAGGQDRRASSSCSRSSLDERLLEIGCGWGALAIAAGRATTAPR